MPKSKSKVKSPRPRSAKRGGQKSKLKGFTLIELLVTISIIAVLSAIGLVVYSTVLKEGRNTKRQSDLQSIQSALEQYFADQLYYPDSAGFPAAGMPFTFGTKKYLNAVPRDPLPSPYPAYNYVGKSCVSNKCSNYCLFASLEDVTANLGSCTSPGAGYNFAVIPP